LRRAGLSFLVRPYSVLPIRMAGLVTIRARRRHIFASRNRKYNLSKKGQSRMQMLRRSASPWMPGQIYYRFRCGRDFVFEPSGKFVRAIGSLKGARLFKRPGSP